MVVLVGGVLARQPRGCHCSSTDPGSVTQVSITRKTRNEEREEIFFWYRIKGMKEVREKKEVWNGLVSK